MTAPYRTLATMADPREGQRCCGVCCPTLGGCLFGVVVRYVSGRTAPAGVDYGREGATGTPPMVFRGGQWVLSAAPEK